MFNGRTRLRPPTPHLSTFETGFKRSRKSSHGRNVPATRTHTTSAHGLLPRWETTSTVHGVAISQNGLPQL
ncbi:unnamed protein product [Danaus chrysippus]|uniref:(African queen) hypothetical protein n=1 Tax=Danaus chrysippus TaxID=151541 RepID=A0A8J2R1S8_9NEOP|nr:unnamed protein product [Danaus chrysippus]